MYVERALSPQSILICDNASCHTPINLGAVLLETGSILIYFPPYSPELNPIEKIRATLSQN